VRLKGAKSSLCLGVFHLVAGEHVFPEHGADAQNWGCCHLKASTSDDNSISGLKKSAAVVIFPAVPRNR
jgi:hypothetical protein